MRSLIGTGLLLSLVLLFAAGAPREASAEHGTPYIQIGATRDGGFHLKVGHPDFEHLRVVARAEYRRDHRLVAKRERLSRRAQRALRAGELWRARRLFLRAARVEARRRGRTLTHDERSDNRAGWHRR